MTTLDEIETRVDDLTDMVRVTDSLAMGNDQRLRAQTSLMMAMREDLLGISTEQQTIKKILAEQAKALGGMIITLNGLQPAVTRLDGRVAIMERRVDRIEQSQGRTERRLDKVDGRLGTMDSRQDRMDKNVEAIMRHLGIPPHKS
jgi:uncharacterized protein (DUF3084 family)